jgi:hypothetical protein
VLLNAIFLKKHERMESLGLMPVLYLLRWRPTGRSMRQYLEQNQTKPPGKDNKLATRPTTCTMTAEFRGTQWNPG